MERAIRNQVRRELSALALMSALSTSCSTSSEPAAPAPASGPAPPASVTLVTANGAVRVDWSLVPEAVSYRVYWSTTPGVDVGSDPGVMVATPPHVLTGSSGSLHVVVTSLGLEGEGAPGSETAVVVAPGSPQKYFPPWAGVQPVSVITFDYDGGQTADENGADLAAVIQSLQPGERLEIGSGTYSMTSLFDVTLQGSASAPIWIAAQEGATPVITRANAIQNAMNMGSSGRCEYVAVHGLEITGGDIALRLIDCRNVWFDRCHIHDCNQNAVAANTVATEFLYFTRNEVHGTGGTGEGFYIGGNFSNPVAHHCVIAMNHVYDCAGSQGDGIEIKQGSYANWIAENVVHDTNFPCILVYGTDGNEVNVIERNLCWGANENIMQVQGEALVRNNVLFDGVMGFQSHDHQGATRDLVVVHNTIVNSGPGANLASWGGRQGMVFANNVIYSELGTALSFPGGTQGVRLTGNVVVGPVIGASGGYVVGVGLSDFVNASWDGSNQNVTPALQGAIIGTADASEVALDDYLGALRVPVYEAGAVESP